MASELLLALSLQQTAAGTLRRNGVRSARLHTLGLGRECLCLLHRGGLAAELRGLARRSAGVLLRVADLVDSEEQRGEARLGCLEGASADVGVVAADNVHGGNARHSVAIAVPNLEHNFASLLVAELGRCQAPRRKQRVLELALLLEALDAAELRAFRLLLEVSNLHVVSLNVELNKRLEHLLGEELLRLGREGALELAAEPEEARGGELVVLLAAVLDGLDLVIMAHAALQLVNLAILGVGDRLKGVLD